jgi:AraC-like DNA-binding protein
MGNPTISAGYPKAFLDFAVSRGADRRTLIARSRIHPDELLNQDNRIPLANYLAMLEAGIELCNEPALSLLFGETVRLPDISVVGLIGELAENSEDGERQLSRYARLALDEDDGDASSPMEIVREGRDLWVRSTSRAYAENPLLTESAFARTVCGARAMMASMLPDSANQPFPKAIRFTHREPPYRAEYDRIFGVPLFFGSAMNAILIDEALMRMKRPRPNPYLSELLRAHAEGLLEDLERSKSMRGRVESLLIPDLHTGEATMEMIARKLAVSRQTLFRKLKAEGVTFENVRDELRRKLARQYLNTEKVSVQETAYLLGLSDPAAFSRAFKRWTGSSPRMVRTSKDEHG